MQTAKTLIRLDCPGWSESSLDVQVILLVLSSGGLSSISSLYFNSRNTTQTVLLSSWSLKVCYLINGRQRTYKMTKHIIRNYVNPCFLSKVLIITRPSQSCFLNNQSREVKTLNLTKFEPRHEKTCLFQISTTKAQISLLVQSDQHLCCSLPR